MILRELLSAFASMIFAVVGVVVRPTAGRCPEAWVVVDGIRETGHYVCRPRLVERWYDIDDPSSVFYPPGRLLGRIYCTKRGTLPTLVTYDRVACKRGRYQWQL